jgi:hypothetical protein
MELSVNMENYNGNFDGNFNSNINYLILNCETSIRQVKNFINKAELKLITTIPQLSHISKNDFANSNITEAIKYIIRNCGDGDDGDEDGDNNKELLNIYNKLLEIRQILSTYLRNMKLQHIIPANIIEFCEFVSEYVNNLVEIGF